MAYAKRHFWLHSKIDGARQTQREALTIVARNRKVDPEKLYKLPKVEPSILYLLRWFYELKRTGDEPIKYSEIESWSRLTGRAVRPNEVDAIIRLDTTWQTVHSKSNSQDNET